MLGYSQGMKLYNKGIKRSPTMSIYEVASALSDHPDWAISRSCWIVKAHISKRITPAPGLPYLYEIFYVDGIPAATLWSPTLEDLSASDWFLIEPIKKRGKQVGHHIHRAY